MRESLAGSHAGSLVLGAWMFLSAFLWPHYELERLNAVIVGGLSVIFALLSGRAPKMRYFNATLGAWLFWSTWGFPELRPGTVYNNLLVSIAMFFVAIMPDYLEASKRRFVR